MSLKNKREKFIKWFKHDSDAHRDSKLRKVKKKYGMIGYALYWHCIELIVHNIDEDNVSFELEDDSELISDDTGIDREMVQEMMTFMVKQQLFESNDGIITCLRLAKRLDKSMTSNPKMRELLSKVRNNHDSVMTKSDKVMQDKTRLEKTRKDKNKVETKRSGFVKPSILEVRQYIDEMTYNLNADDFVDFYVSNGWKVGRNSMKDWKACVRQWNSRNKKAAQSKTTVDPQKPPVWWKMSDNEVVNSCRTYNIPTRGKSAKELHAQLDQKWRQANGQ